MTAITAVAASKKPAINETGLKGFLKWYQREQPGVYRSIAPKLTRLAPAGFSDYTSSLVQNMRKAAGMLSMRRYGQFGDVTTDAIATDDSSLGLAQQLQDVATPNVNIDVSDAANSGTTSTSLTSMLQTLITGASQLYLTKNQLDTANQLTQIQLQRAQAGLPPLNVNMANLGVPTVSVGLSSQTGTVVVIAAVVIGAALLFSGSRKRKAA